MDKPGDRGPLSRSDGTVIMMEVVEVVLVVKNVPFVLVDRRGSEGKGSGRCIQRLVASLVVFGASR